MGTLRRQAQAEHVILVSIDGLLPAYYLDPSWPAPALQQLYRDGVHALAVRPVFPSLTYPGHTTLATGALPARHGVAHDRALEPLDHPRWLSEASAIRVPALWDAVRAAGGTTAALGWPMTVGAAIDWCISDIWAGNDAASLQAIRDAARPEGLVEELEREATGRLRPETFSNRALSHDLIVAAMAAYLFERYRPTLLLVHTQATVQIPQRAYWHDPLRARAVAASDQVLSRLLETVERLGLRDRTAFIAVGDHGMVEVHTAIRPNVWLVEAGLRPKTLADGAWRATFQCLGGSAFLQLRARGGDAAGVVRELLDRLPPGVKSMFRVVDRAELDALGTDPDAAFALAAAPGFLFEDRAESPFTRPNVGMTHGHHPDLPAMQTGFVAAGPGFCAGAVAPILPLTCIAPIPATLLGLDFDAPDGALYTGLLTPAAGGPTVAPGPRPGAY